MLVIFISLATPWQIAFATDMDEAEVFTEATAEVTDKQKESMGAMLNSHVSGTQGLSSEYAETFYTKGDKSGNIYGHAQLWDNAQKKNLVGNLHVKWDANAGKFEQVPIGTKPNNTSYTWRSHLKFTPDSVQGTRPWKAGNSFAQGRADPNTGARFYTRKKGPHFTHDDRGDRESRDLGSRLREATSGNHNNLITKIANGEIVTSKAVATNSISGINGALRVKIFNYDADGNYVSSQSANEIHGTQRHTKGAAVGPTGEHKEVLKGMDGNMQNNKYETQSVNPVDMGIDPNQLAREFEKIKNTGDPAKIAKAKETRDNIVKQLHNEQSGAKMALEGVNLEPKQTSAPPTPPVPPQPKAKAETGPETKMKSAEKQAATIAPQRSFMDKAQRFFGGDLSNKDKAKRETERRALKKERAKEKTKEAEEQL